MKIKSVVIQPKNIIKIFEKHNILPEEINEALINDRPIFKRVGGEQYVAIGSSHNGYVTIFFTYNKITKIAEIQTAYSSTKKQIASYNKVKK